MSGAKWTPGPYAVRESFTSNYLFEITARSPSGKPAVVARISGRPFAQYREGTAALLAAAPDLYAALAELVECVMGGDLDNGGQGVDSDRHDAALSLFDYMLVALQGAGRDTSVIEAGLCALVPMIRRFEAGQSFRAPGQQRQGESR